MTDTIEASTAAAETLDGLRELVAHLERHPALAEQWHGERFLIYTSDPDQFRQLVHDLGGHRTKDSDGTYLWFRRDFGPIEVLVYTSHSAVCERRVVGTEKALVSDPNAPMVEVEREIVEWVCPDSLLGGAA